MNEWIWILFATVVAQLFLAPLILCGILYTILLVRTSPDKWSRVCTQPEDEEYERLYQQGLLWGEKHAKQMQEVSINSDGFNLCGQYFDFGYRRAVIIIPGRTEACLYSYHFAEPYQKAGYNVLVIDNRSHGLSEGRFCSFGVKEYRDILAWGQYIHDSFGNDSVLLHGICIGSSVALYTLVSKKCPDYFIGMTADGMYSTFRESFKNHMIKDRRPLFPCLVLTMFYIRLVSGANVVTDGPIKQISKLHQPILFLHSREDPYSLPCQVEALYALCPAKKRLVWFEHGDHSRIRINNQEEYDKVIMDFWK